MEDSNEAKSLNRKGLMYLWTHSDCGNMYNVCTGLDQMGSQLWECSGHKGIHLNQKIFPVDNFKMKSKLMYSSRISQSIQTSYFFVCFYFTYQTQFRLPPLPPPNSTCHSLFRGVRPLLGSQQSLAYHKPLLRPSSMSCSKWSIKNKLNELLGGSFSFLIICQRYFWCCCFPYFLFFVFLFIFIALLCIYYGFQFCVLMELLCMQMCVDLFIKIYIFLSFFFGSFSFVCLFLSYSVLILYYLILFLCN